MNEASKYRRKKRLGSYPFISVIFSITLALFVIGIFAVLLNVTQKLTYLIREKIEMQVFLHKNITENDILRIRKILTNNPYIGKKNEQPAIRFISKEEAAEQFIRDTGENFREFLGENPLRDAFVINLDPAYQQNDSLLIIKKQLEKVPGIFEVEYMESIIQSVNNNITRIGLILMAMSVILLVVVVVLINNTIKLALFSQRFLIRSMQLVGAKPFFIQFPFMKRSIFHGFISGLIASLFIFLVLNYAQNRLIELSELVEPLKLFLIFTGISLLGALIGFFSTFRAVRKYINMSLDELY